VTSIQAIGQRQLHGLAQPRVGDKTGRAAPPAVAVVLHISQRPPLPRRVHPVYTMLEPPPARPPRRPDAREYPLLARAAACRAPGTFELGTAALRRREVYVGENGRAEVDLVFEPLFVQRDAAAQGAALVLDANLGGASFLRIQQRRCARRREAGVLVEVGEPE